MLTTEDRITLRLHAALSHHENAAISAPIAERGLAVSGPDNPRIVLTVEDVARIAGAAAADTNDGGDSAKTCPVDAVADANRHVAVLPGEFLWSGRPFGGRRPVADGAVWTLWR